MATKSTNNPKTPRKKIALPRKQKRQIVASGVNEANSQRQGLLAQKLNSELMSMTPEQAAIARTIIDPAHLVGTSNGPLFPDSRTAGKAACRVQVQEFNIRVTGGTAVAVYSIPFFEVPVAYRTDDANVLVGIPNRMTASNVNPAGWLRSNNVYGFRTTGKSLSIHNVTPDINRGGSITAARFASQIDYVNASPAGTVLGAATAGTTTDALNIKVLQSLPGSIPEVSQLPTYQTFEGKDGCYLVNKLINEDWILRTDSMKKAFPYTAAPQTTDRNSALGFTDFSAAEGTAATYMVYKNATSGYIDDSVCTASTFDGTDLTVAVLSAPTGFDQTYLVRMVMVTEFLPKLNSTTFIYELKNRSMDESFLRAVKLFAAKELGIYPVSYNDWSSVFNKLKSWLGSARDFYKSNSKIIKPIAGLIPGASGVIDVIDKYI